MFAKRGRSKSKDNQQENRVSFLIFYFFDLCENRI